MSFLVQSCEVMSHPVKFADEGCSSLKVSNHHRHIIYCITYWGRDAGRGGVFAALKVISVEAGHAQSGRGRTTGRGQRARPAPGPDRGRGEGEGGGAGLVADPRRVVVEHVLLHRGVDAGGDVPLEGAVHAAGAGAVTLVAAVTVGPETRAQTPAQILKCDERVMSDRDRILTNLVIRVIIGHGEGGAAVRGRGDEHVSGERLRVLGAGISINHHRSLGAQT